MSKPLVAGLAFIASAILGTVLSVLLAIAAGYAWAIFYERNHSGIGAVAGGITGMAVLVVPILWGIIGTLIVLHREDRRRWKSF